MTVNSGWDTVFDGAPIAYTDPVIVAERHARHQKRSVAASGQRLDIQGLRAVAVVAVIINHLAGWLTGGFVGVDIFFVISGFLITSHLVNNVDKFGRVSFGDFYLKRIRRILPAALVVLAACWITAGLVFRGSRVSDTHDDIRWASGFIANIHFAHIGTNYFQANRPVSPVEHYWSLAVEEQFYIVWPIAITAVALLFRAATSKRRAQLALLVVASATTVASFAWALHETRAQPTSAYFSTPVRAWELGVGATLALTLRCFPQMTSRLGRSAGPISLLGLTVIVISIFMTSPAPGFPAPWAAVPVLATALVILAGSGGNSTVRWTALLTNRLAVYIGAISYSLYLWHFPVIIITAALMNSHIYYYLTVIFMTLGLSMLSFHFVETPFRRSGSPETSIPRPRAALAAVTLLVVAMLSYIYRPAAPQPTFVTAQTAAGTTALDDGNPSIVRPSTTLARSITTALEATTFPDLKPELGALGLDAAVQDWQGCNTTSAQLASCVFKPAAGEDHAKVALVLGDSMALSWLPAIRSALLPAGWTIYGMAREQCSESYVSQKGTGGSASSACDAVHASYRQAIDRIKPDLVVMSSAEDTLLNLKGHEGHVETAQYKAGMIKTIDLLKAPSRRILVLSPPPHATALLDCDTAGSTPASCVSAVSTLWKLQSSADKAATDQTGAAYFDTHLLFCSENNYCPAFIGRTVVRYDDYHITKQYAIYIAPELRSTLVPR